jgi:hypothetical protein
MSDARSIGGVATGRDVIDFKRYDVAPAQLAVDGDIEQRQIAHPAVDLEPGSNGPDVLRAEWRLRAHDLSLIPRHALGCVLVGAWDIGHGDLLS